MVFNIQQKSSIMKCSEIDELRARICHEYDIGKTTIVEAPLHLLLCYKSLRGTSASFLVIMYTIQYCMINFDFISLIYY